MTSELRVEMFDDLLAGSQLGVLSGASTFPGAFESWVRMVLAEHGPLQLVDPEDVGATFSPDAQAVCVGMVGSLPALYEMPFRGDEARTAVHDLERMRGTTFACMAALNAAGVNVLIAVAAACQLRLPLLNCDGQGQILPLIDQTTYKLAGLSPAPLVGVGPWGDIIAVRSPLARAETLTRAAVSGAGGWLVTAMYPALVSQLAAAGIPGAITRCIEAGSTLRSSRGQLGSRLARQLGGRILGRGRVLEITQHRESGIRTRQPAQPLSILLEVSGSTQSEIRLEVRNEVVLATLDGAVAAVAPDVICLLDPLRRRTVDLLDLKLGDVMEVLLLPAHELWHTLAGVQLAGPSSFGLPIAYRKPTL